MRIKTYKLMKILAIFSLFISLILVVFDGVYAVENIVITSAADKIVFPKSLPAGFYQFNNLEIFKNPTASEPPATIEVIQKNEKSCIIYENGKTNQSIQCVFNGEQNNIFLVQIDERATLLGVNQEPALLSDFSAGDKINVLGWLSADSKTIRAAVVRNLENKNFHQSFFGTIKNVNGSGFTLVLDNGDEIIVNTPIVEGAQVTLKGVFDKVNNTVSSVLSILVRPTIIIQEKSAPEPEAPPAAPSAKPSTLFKNFLKVFGL